MKHILAAGLAILMLAASAIPAYAAAKDELGLIPDGYVINGDNSGNQHVPPPPSTTPSAPSSSAQTESSAPKATTINLSEAPDIILALVNKEREKAGLSALSLDDALTEAAGIRAVELETLYSHTRPDGSNWYTVFADNSVELKATGENIAWGQKDAEAAFMAWMNSTKGHREKILSEDATFIGIAVHKKANGKLCWVQLFAKNE